MTLALCQAKFSCDLQGLPCSVGRGQLPVKQASCWLPGKQIHTVLGVTQVYFRSQTYQLAISDHMCGAAPQRFELGARAEVDILELLERGPLGRRVCVWFCERLPATCPVLIASKSLTAQFPSPHIFGPVAPRAVSVPCDLVWGRGVADFRLSPVW